MSLCHSIDDAGPGPLGLRENEKLSMSHGLKKLLILVYDAMYKYKYVARLGRGGCARIPEFGNTDQCMYFMYGVYR